MVSMCNYAYSQTDEKSLDFIIVIDENIAIGSIAKLKMNVETEDSSRVIELNYHPGNLTMSNDEYELLTSDFAKEITLTFDYYEYIGKQQNIYNYEIDFETGWIKEPYSILRVYNLNKKKYRKRFDPLSKEKNYTFELESPRGSFKRIKNN